MKKTFVRRAITCVAALLAAAVIAAASDQPSHTGTGWFLSGLPGRTLVPGATTTIRFEADRAHGTDVCNRFTGTYASKGAALSFGPPAATRMMCAKPEKIMEQEQQFLSALGTVTTARFEGDRLELRAGDGALAVSARKVRQ